MPLSPAGGGRAHSSPCSRLHSSDRELSEKSPQPSSPSSSQFLAGQGRAGQSQTGEGKAGQGRAGPRCTGPRRAGPGSSSYCGGCRPPHPLHPRATASSRLRRLLQMPTAHLIQGGGEKTGSPVLQGQHPHFQPNQVRTRAQSLTPRGSAFSAWGVGETAGAAPPLPTRSPGQISRYLSAHRFPGLQKPSSLGTGDREEDPGPQEFSNLAPR